MQKKNYIPLMCGRAAARPWRLLSCSALSLIIVGCSEGGSDPATPPGPVTVTASLTEDEASRFLTQASFGPTQEEIDGLVGEDPSSWISEQLDAPASFFSPRVVAQEITTGEVERDAATLLFWENAAGGEDQLRQRMVFALSQILVVSDGPGSDLTNQQLALSHYMDILSQNAFGNYRDILEQITYSPAMSIYLTYLRNRPADPNSGRVPDENYARELMQLFTIGLVELGPDGQPAPGNVETYDNDDIIGLAKVFTGLGLKGGFRRQDADDDALYSDLVAYPEEHSTDEKSFLGFTIPANTGPEQSIDMALDHIFAHPNVGPFVSRQLIQRFVTSAPSGAYVQRVAAAFDAGSFTMANGETVGDGRRGDLSATIAAILLDPEARQDPASAPADFGKVREPVLRFLHWARAFDIRTAVAREERLLRNTSGSDRFGQHPFRAPSVFNFYRPFYVAPNTESGDANLTTPELQIVNESTTVGFINTMSSFVRDATPNMNNGSGDAFSPDYSDELALADNPQALIDRLDMLLTNGQLSQETRDRITTVINEIPIRTDDPDREAADRTTRVHNAVLMVVTSTDFLVQR